MELKPCPFCGSTKLTRVVDDFYYAIFCLKCGITGPQVLCDEAGGDIAWNERADINDNDTRI